jgi:hypothetical protein
MHIDVEKEFTDITSALGGSRVSDLVGTAPPFENADFIFTGHKVIAELKCLDEDKIVDERIILKASDLYSEELRGGRAPVVAWGTHQMTTQGFSASYTKKIIDLYKTPIQRQVKKANTQIKTTREKLNARDSAGLLIVANNSHSAIDPWHGWYILNELLKQELYSGINGAVYLTANQQIVHSESQRHVSVWAEIPRPHLPAINADFLSAMRGAWHQRLTVLMGETEFQEGKINLAQLAQLANRKT